jgi:hypothetical protein
MESLVCGFWLTAQDGNHKIEEFTREALAMYKEQMSSRVDTAR